MCRLASNSHTLVLGWRGCFSKRPESSLKTWAWQLKQLRKMQLAKSNKCRLSCLPGLVSAACIFLGALLWSPRPGRLLSWEDAVKQRDAAAGGLSPGEEQIRQACEDLPRAGEQALTSRAASAGPVESTLLPTNASRCFTRSLPGRFEDLIKAAQAAKEDAAGREQAWQTATEDKGLLLASASLLAAWAALIRPSKRPGRLLGKTQWNNEMKQCGEKQKINRACRSCSRICQELVSKHYLWKPCLSGILSACCMLWTRMSFSNEQII